MLGLMTKVRGHDAFLFDGYLNSLRRPLPMLLYVCIKNYISKVYLNRERKKVFSYFIRMK